MQNDDRNSLTDIVTAFDGRLTASDRAVLSVLTGDPQNAVFWSVAEIAERAGVHSSTVVRTAHKLGFDGYPELRAQLRSVNRPDSELGRRSQQRIDSIEQGSNLHNLLESEIAALNAVMQSVSQQQIDEAAELLAGVRTIFLLGRGSAAAVIAHLDRRLRRLGFDTDVALNLQRRDLAERLIDLSKDDAVVVFAFRAPDSLPAGYAGIIEHAAAIKAKSIVISDSTGPTIRPRADLTLSVSRPDERVLQLRTGPLVVCEALAMTLAHKNPARAVQRLEALEVLRTSLMRDKE